MAKHFYSYQFDMPYRSTYLRNWEVPKYYCPKPRRRIGTTKILSNSRGHLLPGVPRPPCNPFGDFVGTWQMSKKITREIANKINGLADKQAFLERCRVNAATTPRSKYQKETEEEKKTIKQENKDLQREQAQKQEDAKKLEEAKRLEETKKLEEASDVTQEGSEVGKVICPIHDLAE